ncbi:MAG: SapC family protein [Paracoccaceae bacterium]
MVRRRAVDPQDDMAVGGKLPLLYKALVPLSVERHGDLRLGDRRDFGFAAQINAVPVTCDEFPQVMRHYPIVIAGGDAPVPVALVGLAQGRNDHVAADGTWREGTYVPAYLRRYPFLLLRTEASSDRSVLAADLSSMLLSPGGDGQALFGPGGATSEVLDGVLDFCRRYETAVARTTAVMAEAAQLGLIRPSTVEIARGGRKSRIEGFSMIDEDALRALPEETLGKLAKRGVLTIFAAHHLSMAGFTSMGLT